jgi:hypothetical protein
MNEHMGAFSTPEPIRGNKQERSETSRVGFENHVGKENIQNWAEAEKSVREKNHFSHNDRKLIDTIASVEYVSEKQLRGSIFDETTGNVKNISIDCKPYSNKNLTAEGNDHLEGTVNGKAISSEMAKAIVDKYYNMMLKLDVGYSSTLIRNKNTPLA